MEPLLRPRIVKIFLISAASLLALLLILCLVLFLLPEDPDTKPPVFTGVRDLFVTVGDGASYRSGVTATDDRDGEVSFEVLSDGVDLSTPGVYRVTYRAKDRAGNVAEVQATVTVKARSAVDESVLMELVDRRISEWGLTSGSVESRCRTLYSKLKANMSYVDSSDKDDLYYEAYRALTDGVGDCFTYYAASRVILERLGIPCQTVTRQKNADRPSSHYWLLVNAGSDAAPLWRHFDACPHLKEYPLDTCLVTDAVLLEYNKSVPGYYVFDRSAYPAAE